MADASEDRHWRVVVAPVPSAGDPAKAAVVPLLRAVELSLLAATACPKATTLLSVACAPDPVAVASRPALVPAPIAVESKVQLGRARALAGALHAEVYEQSELAKESLIARLAHRDPGC